MSLTYSTYTATLQNLLQRPSGTDTNFTEIEPSIIDYAELRIYRELDFLATVTTNTSVSCTVGSRLATYPAGTWVTVQAVNIITPLSAGSPDAGTRNALQPTSREYLDYTWPSTSGAGVPEWFAMANDQTLMFGPFPDQAYMIETRGTIRPTPLSVSNTTTILTNYLPDLFVAASMVFASGWIQNFGAQADTPPQGMSWEQQYQALLKGAMVEEMRKKFMGPGWSSQEPSPIATASR